MPFNALCPQPLPFQFPPLRLLLRRVLLRRPLLLLFPPLLDHGGADRFLRDPAMLLALGKVGVKDN